ncbi:MAG: PAS domain-containing protein [Betaproteobacteria bacterium]|nr:PAS domain-containing protein [Betaproteobacteria bacterium]
MKRTASPAASDSLQQAILNHIPDQAWLKDRDSRYVLVNEAFIAATGRTVNEILGHTPMEIWPAELGKRFMETDGAVVRKRGRLRYEEERPGPSGGMRWYDTIKTPLVDPAGRVTGTVGISRDITDRKEMERELRESRAQLRELNAYLQTVREEERRRISRELHDELGQSLTAIQLGLESLEERKDEAAWLDSLSVLQRLARETILSAHQIATDLRPTILDDLGLAAAIEWMLESFTARTRISHELRMVDRLKPCDAETSTALFRIVQESLTNVSRHSNATQVVIEIQQNELGTLLAITDNGKGMDEQMLTTSNRLGLIGMRERSMMLGGTFNITSRVGAGTRVEVRIPHHGAGHAQEAEVSHC